MENNRPQDPRYNKLCEPFKQRIKMLNKIMPEVLQSPSPSHKGTPNHWFEQQIKTEIGGLYAAQILHGVKTGDQECKEFIGLGHIEGPIENTEALVIGDRLLDKSKHPSYKNLNRNHSVESLIKQRADTDGYASIDFIRFMAHHLETHNADNSNYDYLYNRPADFGVSHYPLFNIKVREYAANLEKIKKIEENKNRYKDNVATTQVNLFGDEVDVEQIGKKRRSKKAPKPRPAHVNFGQPLTYEESHPHLTRNIKENSLY